MMPPEAQTAPMRYFKEVPHGSAVGATAARTEDTKRTNLSVVNKTVFIELKLAPHIWDE